MAEPTDGGAAVVGEADRPAPVTLRSITCSRCAGPLQVLDGERLLTCSHCGTSFVVPEDEGFARRYFPARIDRLEAVGKADAWLQRHPDVPKDIAGAVFTEALLIYVPIWEARAYLVGWEFGKKLRTRAEGVRPEVAVAVESFLGEQPETTRLELVEEGVQEGFFGERRFYQEAADLRALGIGRPHVTGREFAVPYVPGELERGAALLEADGDYQTVQRQARQSFLHPPTGTQGREDRLFLLHESVALLYYPLWELKYRYFERVYEMAVDGRSGVVHSARAPADKTKRLAPMVAWSAALAVVLAVAVSAWEAWAGTRDIYFLTALLLVVAAVTAFLRFHLEREVEYHEPFSS